MLARSTAIKRGPLHEWKQTKNNLILHPFICFCWPHLATFPTQKGECETAFCCEMAHSNEIDFSTLVSSGKEELLLFPDIIVIV